MCTQPTWRVGIFRIQPDFDIVVDGWKRLWDLPVCRVARSRRRENGLRVEEGVTAVGENVLRIHLVQHEELAVNLAKEYQGVAAIVDSKPKKLAADNYICS